MSQYFDKDFLKFFLGFAAIISVSMMIILATRLYEERQRVPDQNNTASVIKAINNQ